MLTDGFPKCSLNKLTILCNYSYVYIYIVSHVVYTNVSMVYPYCKHHQLASSQTHQPTVPKLLPTGHHWAFQHTADELSVGDQAGTIDPGWLNHCHTGHTRKIRGSLHPWRLKPRWRAVIFRDDFKGWLRLMWPICRYLRPFLAQYGLLQRSPNHFAPKRMIKRTMSGFSIFRYIPENLWCECGDWQCECGKPYHLVI